VRERGERDWRKKREKGGRKRGKEMFE